ncbi:MULTISPECIES: acyl carrier protein [Arenibacter]|jgi:acyl carrier protein|uniref:acyl carrier protein n=1 Tax=Arenibacter TaxID=178469 RepID=UPI0004DEDC85|nr:MULTISPECIES: acyl carrier protein [Arenibacter]GBF20069.1 D-alanine--poly(phosphoribitol) ligase subunit 2 [Arenibacter sp. NBRC 103722]|tara:strand:+ start:1933 stop:2181 length:249 start_codon:yes stop_codon:yes gene_type:complete
MITQIETKGKIKDYIINATLSDNKAIADDTLIFETGLLDSMGLLFLIEYLKEEFNVEVSDEELLPENFESVNSIIKFIEGKL